MHFEPLSLRDHHEWQSPPSWKFAKLAEDTKQTSLVCMFRFPNTGHVTIL